VDGGPGIFGNSGLGRGVVRTWRKRRKFHVRGGEATSLLGAQDITKAGLRMRRGGMGLYNVGERGRAQARETRICPTRGPKFMESKKITRATQGPSEKEWEQHVSCIRAKRKGWVVSSCPGPKIRFGENETDPAPGDGRYRGSQTEALREENEIKEGPAD